MIQLLPSVFEVLLHFNVRLLLILQVHTSTLSGLDSAAELAGLF